MTILDEGGHGRNDAPRSDQSQLQQAGSVKEGLESQVVQSLTNVPQGYIESYEIVRL
jgi:hypothetical protein